MNFAVEVKDGANYVRISGDLQAGIFAVLAQLLPTLKERTVIFDLSGLGAINSIGCAEWARAMLPFVSAHLVELRECPVAYIDYANMIPSMLGAQGRGASVMIRSFRAPYFCKACGVGQDAVISLQEVLKTRKLPAKPCTRCGATLPAEVESEDYLQFLDRSM